MPPGGADSPLFSQAPIRLMMLGCWPSLHSTSSSPAKSRWSFSDANSAGRSAHAASLNKVQAKQLQLPSSKGRVHISQRTCCTGINLALCDTCILSVYASKLPFSILMAALILLPSFLIMALMTWFGNSC